jgi:hypothetical protein
MSPICKLPLKLPSKINSIYSISANKQFVVSLDYYLLLAAISTCSSKTTLYIRMVIDDCSSMGMVYPPLYTASYDWKGDCIQVWRVSATMEQGLEIRDDCLGSDDLLTVPVMPVTAVESWSVKSLDVADDNDLISFRYVLLI